MMIELRSHYREHDKYRPLSYHVQSKPDLASTGDAIRLNQTSSNQRELLPISSPSRNIQDWHKFYPLHLYIRHRSKFIQKSFPLAGDFYTIFS